MTSKVNENMKGRVLLFDIDQSIVDLMEKDLSVFQIEVVTFVEIKKALGYIKSNPTEIVLADLNSINDQGAEFLKTIKKHSPSTNRFLLCELDDHQKAIQLLLKGVITKYFEKPVGIEALTKKIHHILLGKKVLKNKKLLKMIHSIGELPAFQSTYKDFSEAIDTDRSVKDIAGILSRDISVSTKILQIANSAYYKITKIGSIERACIYLGLEKIKNIVFIVSLSSIRKLNREQMKHLERIIAHSLKVNHHFHRLYKLESRKELPELYSSVGITHDIGKIILLQNLPKRFIEIVNYQKKNPDISFYRAEIEKGYDKSTHCEIGAYFLDLWNFPEVNVSTALYHHSPELAEESEFELQSLFSLANQMAQQV